MDNQRHRIILNELDNKIYEGKVNVPFGLETEDSGVNQVYEEI